MAPLQGRVATAAAAWRQHRLPAALAALLLMAFLVATPSSPAGRIGKRCAGGGPWPTRGDAVHVAITSNGRSYVNTLALYGTFLIVRRLPGGDRMAAFTRILHRAAADELSPYVPTVRVDPLHPACDEPMGLRCPYVQADRPAAVRAFLDRARREPGLIQAPWLLLIETDMVFVRPVQPPPAESDAPALGFRYLNIFFGAENTRDVLRRLYPPGLGRLEDLPTTGPSPVLMRPDDWARVAPRWETYMAQIEGDAEARAKLGYLREMHAFCLAVGVERTPLELQSPPQSVLMIQPPVHEGLGAAALMHYTWGSSLLRPNASERSGHSVVWRFEKREHTAKGEVDLLPKVPLPPPYQQGWITPSAAAPKGRPTSPALYETMLLLVETINRGIDEVGGPDWPAVLGRWQRGAPA